MPAKETFLTPEQPAAPPGPPEQMVQVRLLRRHTRWNAGEVCGFQRRYADQLLAAGFAERMPSAVDGMVKK